MPTFSAGDRVQADITGNLPELVAGVFTPATIQGPGGRPGTYRVQIDTVVHSGGKPYNVFDLTPDRLSPLP